MKKKELSGSSLVKKKNRSKWGATFLNVPYILWSAIFVIIPMFIVGYYAFTDAKGNFTLENFKDFSIYQESLFILFFTLL